MNDSQRWFWLMLFALSLVLFKLLSPVLAPFLLAALLAYIADPVVSWIESSGASRTLAVIIIFVVVLILLLFSLLILLPLLGRQLAQVPDHIAWLQGQVIPLLRPYLGEQVINEIAQIDVLASIQQHWQQAGDVMLQLIQQVTQSGAHLIAWMVNMLLVPVVSFYLLRDWDVLINRVHGLLPRDKEALISSLVMESHGVLGAFMRGQLLVMLVLTMLYALGLYWIGLDSFLLLAVVSGVVSFVPYLGLLVGVVFAGIAAYMQYETMLPVIQVLAIFGLAQIIEMVVLTPYFVGDRVGLHPVVVIFSIMAGGELLGFMGILLALPVAAVILVLLRSIKRHYLQSAVYDSSESG
ncbi:MAG: AI-2E family transporter [Gammaproteobacteria bacterium]|nr:AI-2E family transporter [Gammaproteobacteria bacterium]